MTGLIVHEWIGSTGGSEKVVRAMSNTYQNAEILALWSDSDEDWLSGRLKETWLARTPLRRNKALALPFMLAAWRNQRIQDADWALVSSHLFAHHVSFRDARTPTEKYVYVHTPARYIWEPTLDHRGAGTLTRVAGKALQGIDSRRAAEATSVAANSAFVRDRIRRSWGLDATVIHPPVEVKKLQEIGKHDAELTYRDEEVLASLPSTFVLSASRFVPYKRLELAIDVAQAARVPAVIAGSGPDEPRLRALASEAEVPVHFVIRPSDILLATLYKRSLAYVFGAVEDFGIMPVEAMAVGTPVICTNMGGVVESVRDGVTGAHLHSSDPSDLRHALETVSTLDRQNIRTHALTFDSSVFEKRLVEWTGKVPVRHSKSNA